MKNTTAADKRLLAGSIGAVALLALTACGDSGDGEPEEQEQGAEESTDQNEASQNPEEDDSEDASTEEAEDPEAAENDEVPSWDEITTLASDAVDGTDSVSMQISAPYGGAIQPDMPDESGDVEIGDQMTQEITGEIFGNARYVESLGGTDSTFHLQGPETVLFGLEDELAAAEELGTHIPFTADDVDGDYVDYSEQLGGSVNFAGFILEIDAAMLEFDSPEGAVDSQDGEDVWRYTEGEDEAVFLADPEAPLPLLLSVEAGGETYEFQFSDWDSAEVPEDIDPEQIASDADLNEAAQP